MEQSPVLWALVGVVVGALLTGVINYILQLSQFKHNKEMFYLQNQSKEQVKETILELLNHRTHIDRSFGKIKTKIGGYNDDELRQLLHEVGAKKATGSDGTEWWFLKDREGERDEKRNKKSKS